MSRQITHLIRRGDIYYADLSPVTGSEQGGIRPVLIIQNNIGNKYSPTLIAAAITGHYKNEDHPTHVLLPAVACGLRQDSTVLLEQLRTLDRTRMGRYIGSISKEMLRKVDAALRVSIGLT